MTLTTGFLELGAGLLFERHFTERGRLGRLPMFVARAAEDFGLDVLGVGVDDRTALCISLDGTAEVRGEGAVTFLHALPQTQAKLAPGAAPFMSPIAHTQLTQGYRYDLAARQVIERPPSAQVPPPPQLGAPSFGAYELSGNAEGDAALGEVRVLDGGDSLALFLGKLAVIQGARVVQRSVVSTRVWAQTAFAENRVGGPQYALALNPHFLALYLDLGVRVQTSPNAYLTVTTPPAGEVAFMLLDSHGVVSVDFSTYVSAGNSVGPRQSVALEGARLHVLRRGTTYDAAAHGALMGVPYGTGKTSSIRTVPVLDWHVSPSFSVNNFALELRQGLPGAFGLVFHGSSSASLPFMGGTLLVGGPHVRMAVQQLDFAGRGLWQYPIAAHEIGAARYFQAWFRDPLHPDGTAVGLSNGIVAELRP